MLESLRNTLARGFSVLAQRVSAEPRHPDERRVYGGPRTVAGVAITPDTAVTISAVWACLRYLSQTVAVLPWHVMREVDNGAEIQRSNPVDWLIYKRPNPEWSSFQFRETLTHWALRWGNGYAEIERDQAGRPFNLWPIHPERVSVCRDTDTGLLFYEVDNGSSAKVEIAAADMFHIRGFGEGVVGVNVIDYAAQSLGWARAAQIFGAAFFGNGATPASVVMNKKPLTPEGLKRQRKEFEDLYKGPGRAGRTAFLDNDADIKSIGMDIDKMQLVETHQYLVEEVARWFGVPPHKIMHLLRATFCLPADSRVFTEAGPKRIADVKVGEKVWSRDATGRWTLSTIERSAPTGIDRILRIRTTNRTTRMNAKHRVLARRAHEVPLEPGQIGGRNVGGKKARVEWRTEYVPAGELKVGDTIVALDKLPDIGVTTAPNGRELTPGFMAFCGLLIGDGNVFASGSVAVARADAAPYMAHYREAMRSEFFAGGRVSPAGEKHHAARLTAANVAAVRLALEAGESRADIAALYSVSCSTVHAIANGRNWVSPSPGAIRPILLREGVRRTMFSSAAAAEELIHLGFGGTARTKRVPGWVFTTTEELRLAFLAGFLDADGSVDKSGRMAFHSVSHNLIEDVRHLCMGMGIPVTNARRARVKTRLPNGESFEGEISAFTCSDPGENRRVPTATPAYRDRMNAGRPFGRKDRAYPRHGGAGFSEEGCKLSRIAEITEEPAETVYDLTVAGTHNFVADGVVVHNSNIEHQAIEVVVDSISPWVKRFEDEADYKLFGQNRRGLYTKMSMNALLRGDMKARMEFYKGMQFVGAYSPNRILQLEDENTLGPEGDIHVMQQQMVPLEFIAEGPVQPGATPEPSTPASEEPPAEEDDAARAARNRAEAWLETVL
jgi:HK97 family phage portal protein